VPGVVRPLGQRTGDDYGFAHDTVREAALVSAPTVIVSGMIAATPRQGGATWAVLQYLLGLRRLGCDVYFVEPLDRPEATPSDSVRYCRNVMESVDFDGRWALIPPLGGEPIGMSEAQLRTVARRAEVLLSIAGMLSHKEVLDRVPVRAYVDLDPVFAQLWHAQGEDMRFEGHTHFVTLADSIGRDGDSIPTCGREWMPTLPPVVLDEWPVASRLDREAITTVGHFRSYGSVHHDGVHYGQKVHSLRPLIDLPRRTLVRFELALAIHPEETEDLAALRENGWTLLDPAKVAGTPDDYRRFVQGSWAEFGLTKLGYVVSGSGWFSDRSACYLASGRPVIAQDTGFGRRLPAGTGLFRFSTAEDVVAAVEEIKRDYELHREAARELAVEYLDSDRVLGSLLERLCR
jgi:hypothetical protein